MYYIHPYTTSPWLFAACWQMFNSLLLQFSHGASRVVRFPTKYYVWDLLLFGWEHQNICSLCGGGSGGSGFLCSSSESVRASAEVAVGVRGRGDGGRRYD